MYLTAKKETKCKTKSLSGCVHAGSSAGSAAAVAARFAPWSLCEDTGGSCRAPAIANGIFGLRPTLGCYNYSDALVLATFTRDTVGMWGPSTLYYCPATLIICLWWSAGLPLVCYDCTLAVPLSELQLLYLITTP